MSFCSSRPAIPRRGLFPTTISAISLRNTGFPFAAVSIVFRMSLIERMSPTPRTTADCWPMLTVTAHIDVAVVQGLQNLRQRQAIGHELLTVDLDLKCLGLA